jgi:uncharacterized membrane protein YkoI
MTGHVHGHGYALSSAPFRGTSARHPLVESDKGVVSAVNQGHPSVPCGCRIWKTLNAFLKEKLMNTARITGFVLLTAVGSLAMAQAPQDPDYEKLLKAATFSLTDAIDKALALKEAKDGVVVNAEIEEEDGKIIYSLQVAQGKKILEVNVDVRDGTLLPLEHEDLDKSAQAKAAKVTVKQAIETVQKNEKGKVVEATLEMKEGKPVCDLKVYTPERKVKTLSVNAETGEIAGGR